MLFEDLASMLFSVQTGIFPSLEERCGGRCLNECGHGENSMGQPLSECMFFQRTFRCRGFRIAKTSKNTSTTSFQIPLRKTLQALRAIASPIGHYGPLSMFFGITFRNWRMFWRRGLEAVARTSVSTVRTLWDSRSASACFFNALSGA